MPIAGASLQDMNEPSNFVRGSVDGCPDSDLENPPYVPGELPPQPHHSDQGLVPCVGRLEAVPSEEPMGTAGLGKWGNPKSKV